MFSRSLLVHTSVLRHHLVCSRSLSTLRFSQPARCAVPSYANSRRLSIAPALRDKSRVNSPTSHTPSGTCYIANIPYNVTADQLKDAFSQFGKIESVRLMTSDTGLSRGVGFIQFESVAEAVNFVDTHMTDPIFVLDRQLFVEHAQNPTASSKPAEPSDTLMVQGESEAEVRKMFGSYADQILAVRFSKKEADLVLRRAFVQFQTVDIATEAMDVFKNQSNGNAQVVYARHRYTPSRSYTLTSRLSRQRDK